MGAVREWVPVLLLLSGVGAAPNDVAPVVPPPLRACDGSDRVKFLRRFPEVALRHVPAETAPSVQVGTEHPVLLVASSPDARWTAFRQARRDTNGDGSISFSWCSRGVAGDRFDLYLARGAGPGEPIDDLVAGSRDGRHLALVRGGSLRLLDTLTGAEVDLGPRGADASSDDDPVDPHRVGSFDDAGTRFVWIHTTPCGQTVVVRTLADGGERELTPGPGALHRAWIDEGGVWVLARAIPRDTNHDGRLEAHDLSAERRSCRQHDGRIGITRPPGDEPETYAALASGGAMVPVPGFVTAMGRYLVRRLPDGALVARSPDGSEREWVPSACWGEVIARSAALERLLVSCRMGGVVAVRGPETHCALPIRVGDACDDQSSVDGYAYVRDAQGVTRAVELAAAQVAVGTPLDEPVRPSIWGRRGVTDRGAFFEQLWFDFTTNTHRAFEGRALSIDVHGRLLFVARSGRDDPSGLDRGPLTWRLPPSRTRTD